MVRRTQQSHASSVNLFLSSLLRAAAVVVLGRAVRALLDQGEGASANPDIGGGAIMLVAVWGLVLIWSWYDGRRASWRTAISRWAGSAVLLAVVFIVEGWARGDFGISLLAAGPIVAVLAVLPALIGTGLGGAGRVSSNTGPQ